MSGPAVPSLPRNLMLGLALGQGLFLLFLWRALDGGTWPSQTPALNFPLWTFAVAWPGLLLLSLEAQNQARVLKVVSLCIAVLLLPAAYIGWQASPFGAFPVWSLLAIYVITMLLACFKVLMGVQIWAGQRSVTYEALFAASWRNFLVVVLSLLLTGGVQAVLYLWGALFAAIGIGFFQELFNEDWFLFPVLAVALGLGTLIFRRLVNLIDGITGLLEGLMRLLLPLALAVLLIFLAALPFTGLAPLWATGNGTALLMWLNAFVLFFLNAVYQTGGKAPYPPLVHRLLQPGIAVLPVLSAMALYGLYLRVDQYGWSFGALLGLHRLRPAGAVLLGLRLGRHPAPGRLAAGLGPRQHRHGLGAVGPHAFGQHPLAGLSRHLLGQPTAAGGGRRNRNAGIRLPLRMAGTCPPGPFADASPHRTERGRGCGIAAHHQECLLL